MRIADSGFLIEESSVMELKMPFFDARGACLKVDDRKSITINTCPQANMILLKYRFSNSVWSGL